MANEFRDTVIGVLLLTGFAFFLIYFAVGIGNEYGKDTSELTGGKLNFTGINQTVGGFTESSEGWKAILFDGQILDIDSVATIFNTGKLIFNFFTLPFNLLSQVLLNVFGLPEILVWIVIAVLIVLFITAIWSLMRRGD